jgi:hypothetical protein
MHRAEKYCNVSRVALYFVWFSSSSTHEDSKMDGNAPRHRREHHPCATALLLSREKKQVRYCDMVESID